MANVLSMSHPANWYFGWSSVLAAFVTGAAIGLRFHREDFWGGYTSFRRRIVRLGHIALAALGLINVVFAISPNPIANHWATRPASLAWMAGAAAMPAVCFMSGWKASFRSLFFIPVALLMAAVVLTLCGGPSL